MLRGVGLRPAPLAFMLEPPVQEKIELGGPTPLPAEEHLATRSGETVDEGVEATDRANFGQTE